jgi:hypothetical protein
MSDDDMILEYARLYRATEARIKQDQRGELFETRSPEMKFEVGKTYQTRSICDHDCIYSFKVLSRTAKFLMIEEHGETYRRGVYLYDGVEHCKPHGTYSMCAVISADRQAD